MFDPVWKNGIRLCKNISYVQLSQFVEKPEVSNIKYFFFNKLLTKLLISQLFPVMKCSSQIES